MQLTLIEGDGHMARSSKKFEYPFSRRPRAFDPARDNLTLPEGSARTVDLVPWGQPDTLIEQALVDARATVGSLPARQQTAARKYAESAREALDSGDEEAIQKIVKRFRSAKTGDLTSVGIGLGAVDPETFERLANRVQLDSIMRQTRPHYKVNVSATTVGVRPPRMIQLDQAAREVAATRARRASADARRAETLAGVDTGELASTLARIRAFDASGLSPTARKALETEAKRLATTAEQRSSVTEAQLRRRAELAKKRANALAMAAEDGRIAEHVAREAGVPEGLEGIVATFAKSAKKDESDAKKVLARLTGEFANAGTAQAVVQAVLKKEPALAVRLPSAKDIETAFKERDDKKAARAKKAAERAAAKQAAAAAAVEPTVQIIELDGERSNPGAVTVLGVASGLGTGVIGFAVSGGALGRLRFIPAAVLDVIRLALGGLAIWAPGPMRMLPRAPMIGLGAGMVLEVATRRVIGGLYGKLRGVPVLGPVLTAPAPLAGLHALPQETWDRPTDGLHPVGGIHAVSAVDGIHGGDYPMAGIHGADDAAALAGFLGAFEAAAASPDGAVCKCAESALPKMTTLPAGFTRLPDGVIQAPVSTLAAMLRRPPRVPVIKPALPATAVKAEECIPKRDTSVARFKKIAATIPSGGVLAQADMSDFFNDGRFRAGTNSACRSLAA